MAVSGRARVIYLDDNHPSLNYQGSWEDSSDLFLGDVHSVFGGRQRVTRGRASVSFSFTGTELRMLGRMAPVASGSGVRPTWRCYLNDVLFAGDSNPDRPHNGFTFCYRGSSNLPAGVTHNFRLEVEADPSAPLWVDSVYIRPNVDSSYSNIWARLTPRDPSVRLGPSWNSLDNGDVRFTREPGSFAEIDFIGTRALWQGSALVNEPSGQSRGTYSIDGGPAIPFDFIGRQAGFDPGHRTYFTTEQLSRGRHNLRVTYEGFEAPLLFNHVFIQDGNILEDNPRTLPGAPAPTTSRPGPSPTSGDGDSPDTPVTTDEPDDRDRPSTTNGLSDGDSSTASESSSGRGRPTGTSEAGDSGNASVTDGGERPGATPIVTVIPGSSEGSSTGKVGASQGTPIGPIIGGVLGGVAVLLAVILLVLFIAKRRRKNARHASIFLGSPTTATNGGSNGGSGFVTMSSMSQPLVAASGGPYGIMPLGTNSQGNVSGASSFASYNQDSPDGAYVKQRNFGTAMVATQSNTDPIAASSTPPNRPLQPSNVRYHQDSGIRLNQEGSLVDVPPTYTPA